jgi:molybdenum-dependent DNA-binding transcriptional regulator ModE
MPTSARPRRPNAHYRWTRAKVVAFLRALALGGRVAAAARAVGMSRQSAYRLRARLGEEFGAVWDEGRRIGVARTRGLQVGWRGFGVAR